MEAESWASLWKENSLYRGSVPVHLCSTLRPLRAEELREAARTFPYDTGLGADNIAPRALARLSDASLKSLSKIFCAILLDGAWPAVLNLVLVVLLPKSDGGRRPIGLLPTVIRVWMRAYSYVARQWEVAHHRECLYAGPSMSAPRAAWMTEFHAEQAAREEMHFAQTMLDLVKAFELIPHHHIILAAIKHGYPLYLLRLSLAAYRLPRTVGIEGVYSRTVVACCGIVAGSGFATCELRVLILDVIDKATQLCPEIRLKVYVDDISVSAAHRYREQVAIWVASATDLIVTTFERDLDLQVSRKKSITFCSTLSIARLTAAASRTRAINCKRAGKLLGVATVGGRRRVAATIKKRLLDWKQKTPRFHVLRRAGVNVAQMVQATGPPAMTYGAECSGIATSTLMQMRSAAAVAVAPEACGKNPDFVLHAVDANGSTVDPAFAAHVQPLRFWALAIWQSWVSKEQISRAFAAANAKLHRGKASLWSKVAGPASAVLASAWRMGWKFNCAFRVRDDRGELYDMRVDPPCRIIAAVVRSIRRWRTARIASAFPCLSHFTTTRYHPAAGAIITLNRGVFDHAKVLARTLRDLRNGKAVAYRSSQHGCAPMLMSAISGGQWPQVRLAATRRFTDDDRCQLCLSHVGTLVHRYTCPATMPVEGWRHDSCDDIKAALKLDDHQLHVLLTRGIALSFIHIPPRPDRESLHWLCGSGDNLDANATVYIDGSATDPTEPEISRLGFALAIVNSDGHLCALANGVPPPWIQDSAGSEAWALYVVLSLSASAPAIITDCLGLLQRLKDGPERATSESQPHARLWGMIFHILDSAEQVALCISKLSWMPSHTARHAIDNRIKSDGIPVSTVNWRGNRLVDAAAKFAANAHRLPCETRCDLKCMQQSYRNALVGLAEVTHAANFHRVSVASEDGTITTRTLRDAAGVPRPRVRGRKRFLEEGANSAQTETAPIAIRQRSVGSAASRPKRSGVWMAPASSSKRRRLAEAAEADSERRFMQSWKARMHEQLSVTSPPTDGTTASQRLAAVRERVARRHCT